MRQYPILALTVVLSLLGTTPLGAQQTNSGVSVGTTAPGSTVASSSPQPPSGAIPRLVKFSGSVKDLAGDPITGVLGLTFALYEQSDGGSPLWQETQTLALNAQGRYTALLGAETSGGLPLDLFTGSLALWVGVQPQIPGQSELPRVLLVAVPYALKSSDADTLGGLPASAYMLAPSNTSATGSVVTPGLPIVIQPPGGTVPPPGTSTGAGGSGITGSGTQGSIAMFNGRSTIGDSNIFNLGGNIGIGTTNPQTTLDVHGGFNLLGNMTLAPLNGLNPSIMGPAGALSLGGNQVCLSAFATGGSMSGATCAGPSDPQLVEFEGAYLGLSPSGLAFSGGSQPLPVLAGTNISGSIASIDVSSTDISGNGGSITMAAGANFNLSSSISTATGSSLTLGGATVTGNAGDITLLSGNNASQTGNGGSIYATSGTGVANGNIIFTAYGTNGSMGQINLGGNAATGETGSGDVTLMTVGSNGGSAASISLAPPGGSGGSNGSITISTPGPLNLNSPIISTPTLSLTATGGTIGTPSAPVSVVASTLTAGSGAIGNVSISNNGSITANSMSLSGGISTANGALTVSSGGNITTSGLLTANGVTLAGSSTNVNLTNQSGILSTNAGFSAAGGLLTVTASGNLNTGGNIVTTNGTISAGNGVATLSGSGLTIGALGSVIAPSESISVINSGALNILNSSGGNAGGITTSSGVLTINGANGASVSTTSGNLSIASAQNLSASAGTGGTLSLYGGPSPTGTSTGLNGNGGVLQILTGDNSGDGGGVLISSGDGNVLPPPAGITNGGDVSIITGSGTGGGNAGNLTVTTGTLTAGGAGGNVTVTATGVLTLSNQTVTAAGGPTTNSIVANSNGVSLTAQAGAINLTADSGVTVNGSLNVTGNLTKGSGTFKIDHPLDPERKYLSHSFVESPDMKNVYDGVIILDAQGEAWVQLPNYFEALNKDFRYQLTCVGGYAPVYVAQEVVANRFQIAGGKPGLKVSWQVTGIRQDAYADKHRVQVEEEKSAAEQGYYLYPDAYGLPAERGIAWLKALSASEEAKNPSPGQPAPSATSPADIPGVAPKVSATAAKP